MVAWSIQRYHNFFMRKLLVHCNYKASRYEEARLGLGGSAPIAKAHIFLIEK